MTRQQRRAIEREAKKRGHGLVEVVIFDDIAEQLAPLFLPPTGSQVSAEKLRSAVERLLEATRAMKRLRRES